MFSFFNRPFPTFNDKGRSLRMSTIAGFIVFIILFGLKPFEINTLPIARQLNISFVYGMATLVGSLLATIGFPRFFPKWFDERQWTVGKEMLFFIFLLVVIALVNCLVNWKLHGTPISLHMVFLMTGYTILIGTIPITLSILLKQQILLKKYVKEAGLLNEWVQEQETIQVDAPKLEVELPNLERVITINGDNQGESLMLKPAQWLAAEANDNYCRIYYYESDQLKSVLFRTTLKKLEEQLVSFQGAYRCHKSFLVNTSCVSHISGNAQGYRLHFKNSALTIPVSRSQNAELKEKLARKSISS
jgi:hypothetical protein